MSKVFDDVKLINIARYTYFVSKSDCPELEKLFNKTELTNPQRNLILDFIENTKTLKPLSIRDMKGEIFTLIGYQSTNKWGTITRAEMEIIYDFIKNIRKSERE